jgi:hypothetical protein
VRRICVALLTVVVVAVLAGPAAAITVSLDGPPVTTGVGHRFTFTTTVANTGASAVSDLVAHLNVLSDDPGTYVDPEDWSSHRTQYLPAISPNGEQKLTWSVQAVNSGNLTVFVSVLPRHESGTVVTSPPLRVFVDQRRTLNSKGALPLTLGIPVLIGLVGLGVRRRRRG